MARRKNTRFIDPRYFMDEKMEVIKEVLKEDSFSDDAQKLTAAAAQRASKIAGKEVSPQELGGIGGQISAMIYHGKLKMPDPATVRGETDVDKFIDAWVNQNAYPQLDKFIQGEMQRLGAKKQPAQPSAQPAADPAGAQKSAGYDKQAARFQENLGGGHSSINPEDEEKAEDIASVLEQSPEIMAAVKAAAQDPKVQAAVQQALAQGGSMQEEEDPYAGDPIGGAYKKRADLQGIGSAAASTVGVAGVAAALAPGALATIGMAAAMTPAMLAMGLVGGPILAGVALMIAAELAMAKHANLRKAADRSGHGRDRSDFSDKEWQKIHSGD